MSEKKFPKKKFRIHKISAAVFEKEDSKKGNLRKIISIQKSSKDKSSGEWQNQTIVLLPNEISALITVAQQAYIFCEMNEQSE